VVNVGGQVHVPRTIEFGADGLTLHRALLSAGGAREWAVAEANLSLASLSGSEVVKLTQVAGNVGKYRFHKEVWDNERELAANAIPLKLQEVQEEIEKQNESLNRQIDELASSLSRTRLKSLVRQGEFIGEIEEKLNLYDKLPGYFEDSRKQYEELLNKKFNDEKNLLNDLIKSSKRASLAGPQTEFLVALERPSAEPPVTYYFPYDLATAGMASEIELQDGDSVSVVNVRETALHPTDAGLPGVENNVSIQGYVEVPGITDGLSTISSVHSLSKRTIDDPRSVWTLVRPAATGRSQMVFVLPDRLVASNGAAADAPTQEGDVYTYTILPQVPIVFETLLARTLETEKHRCLERLRALKQEHKKKTHR
jgi:hypothetical protein